MVEEEEIEEEQAEEAAMMELEAEILVILKDCERQGMSIQEIRDMFCPSGLQNLRNKNVYRPNRNKENLSGGNNNETGRRNRHSSNGNNGGGTWKRTLLYVAMVVVVCAFCVHFHEDELKGKKIHVLDVDDCKLCEMLQRIERVRNISQAAVIEQYIKRERPFIVTDAMEDWLVMKTDQFRFENITQIYIHHNNYGVCNIQTNLRVLYGDIAEVMRSFYSPHTTQWFLHWENCQKESAKATRQFHKRPYFISNTLDFTGSNWVLMSSDFRERVYKKIESSDSLLMLYQIRGFNHIRLSPRETCREFCPKLTETLAEGEILVATNLLWIFEYIPGEDGDNLAIMSEVSGSS